MNTTVYFSGGSHRATLGGIGAILYLLDSTGVYCWNDVDEMVGVSGGSQPIAALAAAEASSESDVSETMRRLYLAIDADRLTLSTPRRRLIVATIAVAATLPVTLWVALTLLFIPALIAFPAGLITVAFVYRVVSWLLSKLQEDYVRTVLSSAAGNPSLVDSHLKDLPDTTVHYSIVSAGVDTGRMYRAWIGSEHPTVGGSEYMNAVSPVHASVASSSLPPTGRLRPPAALSTGKAPAHNEILIDGGVGGNFGLQITNDITKSIVTGKAGAATRRVLALDAGRRVKQAPSRLRMISTVARLMRWVQLSNDATYANDLEDLKDLTSAATAGSIDVATGYDAATLSPVEAQQLLAVQANANLDIFKLGADTIPLAVACGVIGALLTDAATHNKMAAKGAPITVTMADAKHALDDAAKRLGTNVDLADKWSNVT
ncbi:MAG: hypothetical protein AB8G14_07740 [Ilumatobacter sp.]